MRYACIQARQVGTWRVWYSHDYNVHIMLLMITKGFIFSSLICFIFILFLAMIKPHNNLLSNNRRISLKQAQSNKYSAVNPPSLLWGLWKCSTQATFVTMVALTFKRRFRSHLENKGPWHYAVKLTKYLRILAMAHEMPCLSWIMLWMSHEYEGTYIYKGKPNLLNHSLITTTVYNNSMR